MTSVRHARRRSRAHLAVTLGVCAVVACAPRDDAGSGAVPGVPDSLRQTVEDAPALRLGAVGGSDEMAQFSGVVGAVRDRAGRIYVGDAGSSQVRVFDSTGRFVRSFGRTGTGPGEFKWLFRLAQCGPSTIATLDFSGGRFAVFSDSGGLVDTYPLPAGYNNVRVVACAGRDTLIALRDQPTTVPPQRGEVRVPAVLVRISARGTAVDTLGRYPGASFFFSKKHPAYMDLPLGPATMAAVGVRRIFVGTSDRPVVDVLSFDGRAIGTIAIDQPARPVSREQRRAALQARVALEPLARTRGVIERIAPELPQPAVLPFFRDLVADDEDNVWVRTFETFPGRDDVWVGYRATGERFATLVLPAVLQVTEIGRAYVLGIRRDELGVEYVELYRRTQAINPR